MSGRPRDPQLEQRLLAAGWSLLVESGYDALTLTKVAARAGAYRTDVYRRWASKAQLVAEVLDAHLPPVSAFDTGTLRGDLRAYLGDLAASWSSEWIDGLVGLVADLQRDPDAELAFRLMAERRGAAMRAALVRAAGRGEISDGIEPGLVGDLLEGPLMHRRLIARQPLPPAYLDALADVAHQVLTGTRQVRT